jgi:tyrosinase
MLPLPDKNVRIDVVKLKNDFPEKFGIFIMALKNLEDSDDWYRICGIHGNTFKPNDSEVLCPTDEKVVSVLSETGEPFYCKHRVHSFIAWHTPYIYQFELLLNKYNMSKNDEYIALPYLDLTNFSNDYSFMNEPKITILYDKQNITLDNPLATAYYYKDGVKTKIIRSGFLTPKTKKQKYQLITIKNQLNDCLYNETYETFSSQPVSFEKMNKIINYVPLETPHNSLHDVIGGNDGNMGDISISAFDPLFWLHHSNMDRHFYNWLFNNTNSFTKSIYPEKMTIDTYEATHAPFFNNNIYEKNVEKYQFGWQNKHINYMLLKDTLQLEKFPYSYEQIEQIKQSTSKSFIELIDIPIPNESTIITAYLFQKNKLLNREDNFAGSVFWFGVNRQIRNCDRCKITRTNLKIDLNLFVKDNNIDKQTINNYNILIEGESKSNKLIDQKTIIKDGTMKIIINNEIIG